MDTINIIINSNGREINESYHSFVTVLYNILVRRVNTMTLIIIIFNESRPQFELGIYILYPVDYFITYSFW